MNSNYLSNLVCVFLLFSMPLTLYGQSVDLNQGLVARYTLDGNASDQSGNANHGTIHGAPAASTDRYGKSGMALEFDGDDDYISIVPVSSVGNIGDFTISLWMKHDTWQIQDLYSIRDQQVMFDSHSHSETATSDYWRDGFQVSCVLLPDNSEVMRNVGCYNKNKRSFYDYNIIMDGSWHHVVMVRRENRLIQYYDGELQLNSLFTSAALNMQHKWFIGTFSGNNPNFNQMNYNYSGSLDDILFYDRALNECEIEALYNEKYMEER